MRGTASDEGRVYQAGHDQTIVQRQTVLPPGGLRPVTDVTVAPGFTGLPVRPDLFVGRAKELAQLRAALAAPASSAVEDAASTPGSGRPRSRAAGPGAGRGRSPQGAVPATGSSAVATGVVVQAVHGLGGIGKSTLAAHYAATCADDYELLWWITADSAAAVASGLAGLAIALEPELTDVLPLEALTERAVQWLAAHDRWLLILDNVSDPRDVAPSLARTRAGRLLITSRLAAGWHQITSLVVRLDILAEGEAVELLSNIATQGRPGADLDGARELCAELGFLPLAIEQAAAYLRQASLGPRGYAKLLAEHPAVLYDQAAEGGDAERTIARIWRITLDRLTDTPSAGDLLRVLAWYAPDNIPRALLASLADPPALAHSIGRLAAYNMITTDDDTLAVHRLVQAVVRTPDPADPHRQPDTISQARDQATSLLNAAIPKGWQEPSDWPLWRTLLPHVTTLADHGPPDADSITTARLLNTRRSSSISRALQPARSPGWSVLAPPISRYSAPTTPPRWPPATTWLTATSQPVTWAGRSPCTSRPWPTASACSAATTPTR